MSAPVLGIDIAKQKVEVAWLIGGKVKSKSFKNTTEGFETLALWLRKLGIPQVQACLEATGNYGEAFSPLSP
jgi:transposase